METEKANTDEIEALRARVTLVEDVLIEMLAKKDREQIDCYYQDLSYRAWIKQIMQLREG